MEDHSGRDGVLSLPEQVEEESQNKTDNDTRGDGKVESDVIFFDDDVSRQLSKPGNLRGEKQ